MTSAKDKCDGNRMGRESRQPVPWHLTSSKGTATGSGSQGWETGCDAEKAQAQPILQGILSGDGGVELARPQRHHCTHWLARDSLGRTWAFWAHSFQAAPRS